MALFDWNRNGKKDAFDLMMDYHLYEETFGKEDGFTSEDYDLNEDDEDDLFEELSNEDPYQSREVKRENVYKKRDTDDLHGLKEIAGKRTDEILRILIRRKDRMQSAVEFCSKESGFVDDVMDNTQMLADFWVYELNWALEISSLTRDQRIQVLELLMKAFRIENLTSASEHYKYIKENNEYYQYFQSCFGDQGTYHSLFWIILGSMSGNNGERIEKTAGVAEDIVKFHMQLNAYLASRFPGYGFDNDVRTKLLQRMDRTAQKLNKIEDLSNAARYLINPMYVNRSLL